MIPVKLIKESENPYRKTIELIYEAITLFFTTIYKKITPHLMNQLWESIDILYLLTLPYPAPLIDQKYVTDILRPDGVIENVIEWSKLQSSRM